MPRKRSIRTMPVEKKCDDNDDDDFFFDDLQSNSGRNSQEPQQRNAANARERARMRVLSKAFCRLKTTLPWVPADTKLSKLDTLRLASSYIAHLKALLHEPRSTRTPPHPLSLAWPFTFQHGNSLTCSVSQRWNPNANNDTTQKSQHNRETIHTSHNIADDEYRQEYSENEYDDRNYEADTNGNQYYSFGYRDGFCDMRNSYSSDGVVNH